MNKIKLILLAICITGSIGQVFGQGISKVGTTSGEFLLIPVGARASAMGGAVVASVNDASSMYWNPAGLADVNTNELMIEYGNWFLDVNHNFVGIAMPFLKGVAGINITALTFGDFEETTYDQPNGTGRTFSAHMLSVGGSYAAYLFPKFRVGGTVKYVQEKIYNTSSSGIAFDFGTLYELPFEKIRFGVSITNVGSKLTLDGDGLLVPVDVDNNNAGNRPADAKLYTDSFDIPLTLRVGFAWDAISTDQLRTTIAIDGISPSNNYQSVNVGGEVAFLDELLILRAGMPYLGLDDRIQNINAGFGINYQFQNNLSMKFSYAYESYDYFKAVNRISIQIEF